MEILSQAEGASPVKEETQGSKDGSEGKEEGRKGFGSKQIDFVFCGQ